MIIGPHTPPFSLIQSIDTLNAFSELGIIMFLFVIGTDFPIAKLRSVGRISIVIALSETIGTMIISYYVAQALQFSFRDSLFLALGMSISSTIVIVRILEELNMIRDKSATLMLGVLIVEDIIAITALGIFQSIAIEGLNDSNQTASIIQIGISVAIVTAFIGITLAVGSRFIPNIIDKVGKTNDYALLLISILGLAFGLSFLASSLELSVATGAFLAGVLVAESKSAAIARVVTVPLRDVFAALFFISIGALMDISQIPFLILPALILIVTTFASKLVIISVVLLKAGYDRNTALRTGLGLSSARAEMSLVVAKTGQQSGAISTSIFPIIGIVTIITTFITPYVMRFAKDLKLSSTATSD
jgi:CPA2 family monovalent cation:H+ antiporter-2